MSATGRGAVRADRDLYETPAWAVERLLDRVAFPAGGWLEPACGFGAIVRAVNHWRASRGLELPRWRCCDLDPASALEASGEEGVEVAVAGDYVRFALDPLIRGTRFEVAITNPPYRDADRFVRQALEQAPIVAMLLRLNWLAGERRADWLRDNTPDVFVLPNRPDFTGGGGDATDYAWIVWGLGEVGGQIEILDSTPREGRKRC